MNAPDDLHPLADEVIPTVAGPREHFSRETYAGAELIARSSRPGAYDALRLPSLFNGKRSTRGSTPLYPPDHNQAA